MEVVQVGYGYFFDCDGERVALVKRLALVHFAGVAPSDHVVLVVGVVPYGLSALLLGLGVLLVHLLARGPRVGFLWGLRVLVALTIHSIKILLILNSVEY